MKVKDNKAPSKLDKFLNKDRNDALIIAVVLILFSIYLLLKS